MATTYKELKEAKNKQQIYNDIKSDGYRLLQEGKIDEETYYAKTREIGIEMGLIDPRDYPGRLPSFAKPLLQIAGGVGGAIKGGIAGAAFGPVGAVVGAGLGAGAGSGSMTLAADFLGDLAAPEMPAPTAGERIRDAATTAAIDTALTVAIPVAGKALKPSVTKLVDKALEAKKKIIKETPDASSTVGMIESRLGLTEEAAKQAKLLAEEGVPLSIGQASTSPVVRGVYNLSSRMPLAGTPGQKQLKQTFEAVDKAINKRISPTAKLKPMTETERSKMIQKFGMESFKDWRNSYKAVYKKAEQEMRKKGDFFSVEPLRVIARRNLPKSQFQNMPADAQNLMLDINLYGDALIATTKRKGADVTKMRMNFDDVEALDFRLKDLSKKYDPAKSDTPNNLAYRAITSMQEEMKRQLRNPQTKHGRLYSAGDRLFKEYMSVVEGKTGQEFQKALSRGALRPGVGRPPTQRIEDLYKNTFGDARSPEAVVELKNLIGTKRVNILAGNYLDDVFTKHLRGEKRNFQKLYDELGFDNPQSKRFEATKELLKDYQYTNADDLFTFLNVLKEFPEALPDVNTFILRSGILRSAQGITPAAILGTTGLSLGGGATAIAGFGVLRALNTFLAQPFNKNLIKEIAKREGKRQEQAKNVFIQRFLESLPKLPDVPVSALAVQPAVPAITEQVQR